MISGIHHIAIICSNIEVSKRFYTEVFEFTIVREVYREERDSWKIDLELNGTYCIELFTFHDAPKRLSRPEAQGLRHLAFAVQNIDLAVNNLLRKGVSVEPIRMDEFTDKKFTFIQDPDGLPIELYEL